MDDRLLFPEDGICTADVFRGLPIKRDQIGTLIKNLNHFVGDLGYPTLEASYNQLRICVNAGVVFSIGLFLFVFLHTTKTLLWITGMYAAVLVTFNVAISIWFAQTKRSFEEKIGTCANTLSNKLLEDNGHARLVNIKAKVTKIKKSNTLHLVVAAAWKIGEVEDNELPSFYSTYGSLSLDGFPIPPARSSFGENAWLFGENAA
jgi:hypothetical protein